MECIDDRVVQIGLMALAVGDRPTLRESHREKRRGHDAWQIRNVHSLRTLSL